MSTESNSSTPPAAATAEGAGTIQSVGDATSKPRAAATWPDPAGERFRQVLRERYVQHGEGLDQHYRELEQRRPLNNVELRRWAASVERRLRRLEQLLEGHR